MKTEKQKTKHVPWDIFIQETLRSVRQRGLRLFAMGILVYGGATAAIFYLVSDPILGERLQSILFPLCIMYASMVEVFPCVRGAFLTSVEASNRSVPVMEDMGDAANKLTTAVEKNEGDGDIVERLEKAGDRVVAKMKDGMKLDWKLPDVPDPLLDGEVSTEPVAVCELEHEQRGMMGETEVRPDTETRAFPALSADARKGNGQPVEVDGT